MKLSELLEAEKNAKLSEIILQIRDRIHKVPVDEQDDAIEYNKNLFYKEKHELFLKNPTPMNTITG